MIFFNNKGTGKTYTMMGQPESDTFKGIIPRSFSQIMEIIASQESIGGTTTFLVRCSFLEIYNEAIHDLLGSDVHKKHEMKEHPDKGVYIRDLSMNVVKSTNELLKWMHFGNKNRSTGETLMNKDSSRSHSIFTVHVEVCIEDDKGTQRVRAGKLNLVDLAGSERQSKTHAVGDRLKEAMKINLSLSALGNVISALVDGKKSHVPYRDSKLTRLL